jgi:hypothetical protein
MDRNFLIFAVVGIALCHPASGQTSAQPLDKISEKAAPGAAAPNTDLSTGGGDLSDKLSHSNGVIHPQGAVDPNMQKAAPATGATPVIPPPGAPGGATGVQPK